jgi:hypothetical protein
MDYQRARKDQLMQTHGSERADDVYPARVHVDIEKRPKTQKRKLPNARQPSRAELQTRIAELEGKLARAGQPGKLRFSVSAKGRVMVLGLGKFPVALYRGQWERLFGQVDELKAFITANAPKLSSK